MDAFRVLGGCQQRGKQFNVIEDETTLILTHAKGKGFDVLCATYVRPIAAHRCLQVLGGKRKKGYAQITYLNLQQSLSWTQISLPKDRRSWPWVGQNSNSCARSDTRVSATWEKYTLGWQACSSTCTYMHAQETWTQTAAIIATTSSWPACQGAERWAWRVKGEVNFSPNSVAALGVLTVIWWPLQHKSSVRFRMSRTEWCPRGALAQPSRHFVIVRSLSLWPGANFEFFRGPLSWLGRVGSLSLRHDANF